MACKKRHRFRTAACAVFLACLAGGCGRSSRQYRVEEDALRHSIDAIRLDAREVAAAPSAQTPGETPPTQPPARPAETLDREASLETVLRLALQHSPKIEAARRRWHAASRKHAQVTALPDPMLNFRYFVQNVETRTGPQKWALGLSQRIPYPGKLIIAGKAADKMADAAYLRYEAATRNEIALAKEAYFELYYIDRAQQVTEQVARLYERYAALAAGGEDVGRTKLPETFRAESQRTQLGYDLVLLKEMRTAEEERLRAVMGLVGVGIGRTADVADPAPVLEPLEQLQQVAKAYNQELRAAGIEVERAEYETKLAKRAPIPDLTIGADYIKTGEPVRALRHTDDGSKDPIALGVGISLPLWFPKYRALAQEARDLEEAARKEQQAVGLQIRADLARAYFELSNAARLVRLYRDTLLPQARQAQQSAEELHRNGEANLASVLEVTATVHNFELARLRATADFYRNVARLERVLGTALEWKAQDFREPEKREDAK